MDTQTIVAGFSEEQRDYLSSLHVINRIDTNLKAIASVNLHQQDEAAVPLIQLQLELYFYGKKVDTLSFALHNYDFDDVVHLAKNIKDNEYLLCEIDNFLAGDIVE